MKFYNIVSNHLPKISISSSVEYDISNNIADTKNNENIVNNKAGVYFGQYAWE